jgi:hypothetical protein
MLLHTEQKHNSCVGNRAKNGRKMIVRQLAFMLLVKLFSVFASE